MTAPRKHWTSAPIIDWLPTDVAADRSGGLIDLYVDTNEINWHRVRLTIDQAAALHHQLAKLLGAR